MHPTLGSVSCDIGFHRCIVSVMETIPTPRRRRHITGRRHGGCARRPPDLCERFHGGLLLRWDPAVTVSAAGHFHQIVLLHTFEAVCKGNHWVDFRIVHDWYRLRKAGICSGVFVAVSSHAGIPPIPMVHAVLPGGPKCAGFKAMEHQLIKQIPSILRQIPEKKARNHEKHT